MKTSRLVLVLVFLFLTLALLSNHTAFAASPGTCSQLFEPVAVSRPVQASQTFRSGQNSNRLYAPAAIELLANLDIHGAALLHAHSGKSLKPEQKTRLRILNQLVQTYRTEISPHLQSQRENEILRLQDDSGELHELIDGEQLRLQTEIENRLSELRRSFIEISQPGGDVAIVEIGPSRAGSFHAYDLKRLVKMYDGYSQKKGWRVSVLAEDYLDGELRHVSLKVEGPEAYRLLRFDRGDHRFIDLGDRLVANSGKRFTRYASVKVYRPPEAREFQINLDDFLITATRSSGPGGQHVNKTDSAVHVTHRPSGLSIKTASERSQNDNRRIAIEILTARLFDHFQKEQAKALRDARTDGEANDSIETTRWTRTYDWSSDSAYAERTLNGDLDWLLLPLQEAMLRRQLQQMKHDIDVGRFDWLK